MRVRADHAHIAPLHIGATGRGGRVMADGVGIGEAPHVRPGEGTSAWLLGELYTIKVTGAETGGAFLERQRSAESPPFSSAGGAATRHVDVLQNPVRRGPASSRPFPVAPS